MTLTEKWKKGELPDGFYYFKMPDGAIEIASEYRLIRYNLTKDADKIEVLAPVPSYEEWQDLKEFADYSLHNRDELTRQINFWMDKHTQIEKENQQLKELLKEIITDADLYYCDSDIELRIDNAIGEKK